MPALEELAAEVRATRLIVNGEPRLHLETLDRLIGRVDQAAAPVPVATQE